MALFFYKERNKDIRAAAYLRLSIEDGDKAESNSIGNQRELIRDFAAERPGLHLVEEYADDGYTGTNFERPGFKRMMEDIKSGKINGIIVKDLSRLGRNYIEMGKYLEQIFPMMGIRFIAINDNYDNANTESSDSDSIVVPFKNLLNDSYCRDISIKVRSQLDMKRRKGEFIGGYAIYGYCKDERNKNRLVVDEYAADIVRSIYRRKLEGMSAQAIAEQLNSENVLAPSEYKRLCGLNYHSGFKAGTHAKWQAIQVLRILKNEIYTGTMVQGRRQKINYKIKKIRDVEESGWIRVPNMHEAIIPQKLFDTVQEVLKLDTCASMYYCGPDFPAARQAIEETLYAAGIDLIVLEESLDTRAVSRKEVEDYFEAKRCEMHAEIMFAWRRKQGAGFRLTNSVPFGYIRRNGESNMVKDEEVAPYLSEAFFRYASGQKMRDIAKWLNEQGVEPPMKHKKRILGKPYDAEPDQWTTDMLRCLFRNPTYTGAMANGSRQIIAENCHEPFQQMMDGVRNGKIDTIIVKDLSRFGRDYIGVGEYMEQIFPLLGVRLIAINDNYDSNNYKGTTLGMDVVVSNLVNTMYCRDAGKKLRTANQVKWRKGITTASAAPFGYQFDPDKKGAFIIDPPAAKIVRRIFDLAILGLGTRDIAMMLNDESVPVPSVYNKENKAYGKETTYTIAPVILWDSSRVWKILTAYVYTGAMVLGKTKTLISGKSIIRTVPKGQRYITEGTHEAIVSREEFEKAQLVIKSNSHKVLMGGVDFPLKGKVRCGNCRRVMAHNFKQAVPTFWCREGLELVGQTQCTSEVFQVSDIENAVFQALKKELSLLDSLYGDIQKEEQDLKEAHKKANRRKTLMEQELKNLKGEKMRMYEEYAAGTLPLDTYKQKKQECDRRISEVQEQIEQSKAEESAESVVPGTVRAAAEQAENFLHGTRLTAGMVSAFIENVFVHLAKQSESIEQQSGEIAERGMPT